MDSSSSSRNDFEKYHNLYTSMTPWRGNVDIKLEQASPYYFFLTRITDSEDTYHEPLTISFGELLDPSLGPLEHSVHINFMVEVEWLVAQYLLVGHRNPSMTILYDSLVDSIPKRLNVTGITVRSPFPFGHHHTKMSIFFYEDKSLRFAIYTANLIESDWENRTQGVWVSPRCPYLGEGVPINYGESSTLFKCDILSYLNSYHLPQMREWLIRIQHANLSEIRVCLVASVPGHVSQTLYGYRKMAKLVKEYVPAEHSDWDLIAQCSSIGSLGANPDSWLLTDFTENMGGSDRKRTFVRVIYPSVENVRLSHDGMLGGACLPYQSVTHKKQLWLNNYLFQWKSDHRFRSKAVPHIKSYTKISPDNRHLSWFLLTSANLSKAAWGMKSADGKVKILSYELGVLFLPEFLIGKKTFSILKGETDKDCFPLPYDVPLSPYSPKDEIFLYDKCFRG